MLAFSQKSPSKAPVVPNSFVLGTKTHLTLNNGQKSLSKAKNILGKVAHSRRFNAIRGEDIISFSKDDLRAGMYIYDIQNSTELISKRFVIK